MTEPIGTLRQVYQFVCATALVCFAFLTAPAQQPFVTDDADVTPKGKFHFEFSNEFDLLQRLALPNVRQNTADFELDYGLFEGFEVGIAAPLLTIINDPATSPRSLTGLGDMNLSLKYNFRQEREKSRLPAMTVVVNFEL